MKSFGAITFACLFLILSAFRSDNINCESFYPTIEGASLQYAYYDDKEKITGYSKQSVINVKDYNDGVEVTMQLETTDKKGENPYTGEMTFRCEGNKFYMDMSNMLPAEMMDAYKDMEIEMNAEYLEFPTNPTVGQTLPDGSMTMKINNAGMTLMTMTVDVTNRKVDGFETITTPAGTFECVKFSQTTNTKAVFKMVSNSTTWFAKDVGMVRSEDYNDKGKLRSVQVLTDFKK